MRAETNPLIWTYSLFHIFSLEFVDKILSSHPSQGFEHRANVLECRFSLRTPGIQCRSFSDLRHGGGVFRSVVAMRRSKRLLVQDLQQWGNIEWWGSALAAIIHRTSGCAVGATLEDRVSGLQRGMERWGVQSARRNNWFSARYVPSRNYESRFTNVVHCYAPEK